MDNVDSLISDLCKTLSKKYLEQYYLLSSNLSVRVKDEEIYYNWICFLQKNKIEAIANNCSSDKEFLVNLINKDQHKIKNKLIFSMDEIFSSLALQYFLNNTPTIYLLTTRENAQKLVVLGSFEN